jgi:hypothetical protein
MVTVQLGDTTMALLKRSLKDGQTYDERIIELLKVDKKLKEITHLIGQAERILGTDLCPKDKVGPIAEALAKMRANL